MTFPQTLLPFTAEIQLGSTWTDITQYVRGDPGVVIRRGRADETRQIDPSSCTLTLENDGRFSPRNPTGAYYGLIGRNTPLRVSVARATTLLSIDEDTGTTVGTAYVSTPDTGALDITGDLDLRFDADLDSWRDFMDLVGKWTVTGNQRSYQFYVAGDAGLVLVWSTDGTTPTFATSTVKVPVQLGRLAVRATLDVNNGASGKTVTFYTAPTIAGPWTQLGDPVTTAGTTSVFSSSSPAYVVDNPQETFAGSVIRGKVYAAQIYNGIGGTLVANPDFTAQTNGATSFADSTGKTWTLNGSVSLTTADIRFRAEIAAFPQASDRTTRDVTTTVEGAGILRRLNQGQAPTQSTMHRIVAGISGCVAYWGCEDSAGSTTLASGVPLGRVMRFTGGTPQLASDASFPGSGPIMTVNGAALDGAVVAYTGTNNVQFQFLVSVPSTGAVNGAVLGRLNTSGTAGRWDIVYSTGGALRVLAYDSDGVNLFDSGPVAFAIDGHPVAVVLQVFASGANLTACLKTVDVFGNALATSVSPISSKTVGAAQSAHINPGGIAQSVGVGHIAVYNTTADIPGTPMTEGITGYAGEAAGRRIQRLCAENSIPFFLLGDPDDTAAMGSQGIDTPFNLLQEAANTDLGILYEPRDQYGLTYRGRRTLYNQAGQLEVSYSGKQVDVFAPTDDDQATNNDVTVQRAGGSSFRAQQATGPLSVLSPPSGVGIYATSVTLSLAADPDTQQQAGWRLHLGTINEPRFPQVGLNLANPDFIAAALTPQAVLLDVGDVLLIDGPPSYLAPDQVQQVCQGFTEQLSNYARTILVNCSPASPYTIARYAAATVAGANQFKYSSDGSSTSATMTTTATAMSVATPSGPLWTTDAAQMPIDLVVGGERMSATAVSGSSSPQTFTVTRSVNGVVKTHASGETVALFRPARYAL